MKFYARGSSRVPFLYLINKQPNLAFLSGRLSSSSDLALSRSSLVQRSFFCDVIAITSWEPDVVNLVRPVTKNSKRTAHASMIWRSAWRPTSSTWLRRNPLGRRFFSHLAMSAKRFCALKDVKDSVASGIQAWK